MMRCDAEGVPKLVQKIVLIPELHYWKVQLLNDEELKLDIYDTVQVVRSIKWKGEKVFGLGLKAYPRMLCDTGTVNPKVWDECYYDVEKYVEKYWPKTQAPGR